jgi:hypothetical protein
MFLRVTRGKEKLQKQAPVEEDKEQTFSRHKVKVKTEYKNTKSSKNIRQLW